MNLAVLKNKLFGVDTKPRENVLVVAKRHKAPCEHIVYPADCDARDVLFVKAGIDKMFRSGFFSVCEITNAIEIFRVNLTPYTAKNYALLRTVHCLHWNQMSPEIYASLPEMISEIFMEGPISDLETAIIEHP